MSKTIATRYRGSNRSGNGLILDELCETTGWHRSHARNILSAALRPKVVRPRRARRPIYGADVLAALRFYWAVLGAPTGKRLPRCWPIWCPGCAGSGSWRSAIRSPGCRSSHRRRSIRRLAPAMAAMALRGRWHAKPGSLLKDSIRTWAQWDDATPGSVEIDLVGHEGGNAVARFDDLARQYDPLPRRRSFTN